MCILDDQAVRVLDVMIARVDGPEMCRHLRGTDDDLPILGLTARHAVSDRVAALVAGVGDYLPKPGALEELRAVLRHSPPEGAETAECGGALRETPP